MDKFESNNEIMMSIDNNSDYIKNYIAGTLLNVFYSRGVGRGGNLYIFSYRIILQQVLVFVFEPIKRWRGFRFEHQNIFKYPLVFNDHLLCMYFVNRFQIMFFFTKWLSYKIEFSTHFTAHEKKFHDNSNSNY